MWNYLTEAHRAEMYRDADTRRLAKIARDERPLPFMGMIVALRCRLAMIRLLLRTSPTPKPTMSRQEIKACADA